MRCARADWHARMRPRACLLACSVLILPRDPRSPLLSTQYHWIHHHTFCGNYGSPAVPLDKLFGCHFQLPKREAKKAA